MTTPTSGELKALIEEQRDYAAHTRGSMAGQKRRPGDLSIEGALELGDRLASALTALEIEREEDRRAHASMLRAMARQAREEGNDQIADWLDRQGEGA